MSKIGVLILLLFAAKASALSVPRALSSGRSGMAVNTLGGSCYTLDAGVDVLPCNPAYLAKERERAFKIQLYGGNNISYLNEATEVAQGKASEKTVQKLFSERKSSELEATASLGYVTETFGFSYEPYRVSYYSQFQNSALPEITAFATLEDSAKFQFASYVANDLYLGLQVRYLHRQVVASRFFLTDILAENRNDYLQPHQQKFVFFEPGVLYSLEDHSWRPEVSLALTNWGLRDGSASFSDPVPEYHLGFGVAPDFGWGRWGWALDTAWHREVEDALEMFTLGSYFEMGILKLYGSLNKNAAGGGFTVLFDHFNLGLSYVVKTEKVEYGDDLKSNRLYFMLGAEI